MKSLVFILIMMSGVVSGTHSQTANDIPRLTQAMDAVVQLDSRSWMFNRYDVGSMTGVYVSDFGDISVAHGDYTYNRGVRGWVRIQFTGEQICCVEYHDFAGTCRPVGRILRAKPLWRLPLKRSLRAVRLRPGPHPNSSGALTVPAAVLRGSERLKAVVRCMAAIDACSTVWRLYRPQTKVASKRFELLRHKSKIHKRGVEREGFPCNFGPVRSRVVLHFINVKAGSPARFHAPARSSATLSQDGVCCKLLYCCWGPSMFSSRGC